MHGDVERFNGHLSGWGTNHILAHPWFFPIDFKAMANSDLSLIVSRSATASFSTKKGWNFIVAHFNMAKQKTRPFGRVLCPGDGLLLRRPLPSALTSLTSEFGMGSGVTSSLEITRPWPIRKLIDTGLAISARTTLIMHASLYVVGKIDLLVPFGYTLYSASTYGLSTFSSRTGL